MAKRKAKGPLIHYRFRCTECGLRFRAATYEDDPPPECPNEDCGKVQTPIGLDVAAGKAPGIGGHPFVKAMDKTADMVMADYGMTDLASARQGESMAPKLPPAQQERADAMFNPAARASWGGGNPMMMAAMQAISAMPPDTGQGIDPIGAIHHQRYRPPVHTMVERPAKK